MISGKSLGVLAVVIGLGQTVLAQTALAQTEGVLTRQYEDGGIYEGEFRDGLQHGQGTYRLPNGFEYTGEWLEGAISGQGVARYPSGAVYEGAVSGRASAGYGQDDLCRRFQL
jgi:hypothetical protein